MGYFIANLTFPTKNKATYSLVILLIKKCVFTCILAIYDKKDSVNNLLNLVYACMMCKHWKNEKAQVFTPELWHSCAFSFLLSNFKINNNFATPKTHKNTLREIYKNCIKKFINMPCLCVFQSKQTFKCKCKLHQNFF